MDLSKSIARLYVNGQPTGTGWLINLEYVITAAHCLGRHTKKITLKFSDDQSIATELVEQDIIMDVALLKIQKPQPMLYKRLEIIKIPEDLGETYNWKAHGYPASVSDRFNAGITIGGEVRNFDISFDKSPVIQLVCTEGVNFFDSEKTCLGQTTITNHKQSNLGGISGAPVMIQGGSVVGVVLYAPPEFGERVIVAAPINEVIRKFKNHLPDDLHITDEGDELEFDFSDDFENREDAPSMQLKDFQKNIYNTFDTIGIRVISDYKKLSEEEKLLANKEILGQMIGLGFSGSDLVEINHVNTRFSHQQLNKFNVGGNAAQWDVLHRKSAIYADHSIICIPPIKNYADSGNIASDRTIGMQTINFLLQHRPLIELGKMSVVPEIVKNIGIDYQEQTVFNVAELDTTKVDLTDPVIKSFFFREGKMLKRSGLLMLNSPSSTGLELDDIMEVIEAEHPDMYAFFQSHLKTLMSRVSPDDSTHALKCGLREVDLGIQELDNRYQMAKKRQKQKTQKLGAGVLAIGLYSESEDAVRMIQDALFNAKLSSMISYTSEKEVGSIPDDVRNSPFFIPWLIHHRS